MLYRLSQIVPVRFHSTFSTNGVRQRSVWWQWRGRVWRHRLSAP